MSGLTGLQTFFMIGVAVGAVGVCVGMILLFWALIRPQSSITTQKAGKVIMYALLVVFACYTVLIVTAHS
ncbi:MAG: hypothetical protein VZR02_02400 [Lachnospiraceae bacterium]|nr:hypothetical protein [Lachnospiraceae bacterium]